MNKTILFINPTAEIGGAEVNLIEMCKGLPNHQINPIVCCPEGPLSKKLDHLGIHTILVPDKTLQHTAFPQILLFAWKLKKRLQPTSFDMIHANSRFSMYISLYLGLFTRKKVVLHWADYDIGKGDTQLINLFKKKTQIIAVSHSIKDHLIRHKIPKRIITTVHNGTSEPTPKQPISTPLPKDKCIVGIQDESIIGKAIATHSKP